MVAISKFNLMQYYGGPQPFDTDKIILILKPNMTNAIRLYATTDSVDATTGDAVQEDTTLRHVLSPIQEHFYATEQDGA